ncbi:hypothetical protein SLEP1_g38281 [Rubroshorea leprosula]|uniref:Uncharacterized protein n=1 Tax=Rubroshorea leprosula TaxID=152421 RepID=A0AAV5KXC8_9ROSI|nr:hypothetical protein SLEP1_g38281 [Rubroshorea leprosula]
MAISASSLAPRTCPRSLSYAPLPLPPQFSFHSLHLPSKQLFHPRRALRELQEYEEAVKRKDPARALRFLKSIEKDNGDPVEEKLKDVSLSIESPQPQLGELGFVGGLERDWEVLDTCLNASDMRLVGGPYGFLKDRGFLPNFGKFSSIVNN